MDRAIAVAEAADHFSSWNSFQPRFLRMAIMRAPDWLLRGQRKRASRRGWRGPIALADDIGGENVVEVEVDHTMANVGGREALDGDSGVFDRDCDLGPLAYNIDRFKCARLFDVVLGRKHELLDVAPQRFGCRLLDDHALVRDRDG